MEPLSTWENLLLGAFAVLVLFWMRPGIKAAMQQSKTTKSDWAGAMIPLSLVILFVLCLIAMVKS